jgi:hypothetical protein
MELLRVADSMGGLVLQVHQGLRGHHQDEA